MEPARIEQAGEIAAEVKKAGVVAVHLETFSHGKTREDDPWNGGIRAMVLAIPGQSPWFLDLEAWGAVPEDLAAAIGSSVLVAHGAQSVLLWLGVKQAIRPQKVFCTRTAAWLLSAGMAEDLELDAVLARHLRLSPPGRPAPSDWGGLFLTEEQVFSATDRVDRLHELCRVLKRGITSAGLRMVCQFEMELIPVVAAMEECGIAVDADFLGCEREESARAMQEAAQTLAALLRTPSLNPSSPSQLIKALARVGISVEETGESSLKAVDEGVIIPAILDYRAKEKVFQQAGSLLAGIRDDGRIHARFDPAGTDTGRFSSHSPNLQNIGRGKIRAGFVAPPGSALVMADYSQIELRAAAAISGEEKMITAYGRGTDLHVLTAAAILDKPAEEVNRQDRQIAKSANFGLLYGQGAKGLVSFARQAYGVTLSTDEALGIRTRFFSAYPAIARWHDACSRMAGARAPEARTITGRRRLIPSGADRWQRFSTLINTPVQGGCADGLKLAMIALARALPSGARMVSTVHDELLIECREDQLEEVSAITRETMGSAMQKLFPGVPIQVDIATGPNWAGK